MFFMIFIIYFLCGLFRMATPVTPKKQGKNRFWFKRPCFNICLSTYHKGF